MGRFLLKSVHLVAFLTSIIGILIVAVGFLPARGSVPYPAWNLVVFGAMLWLGGWVVRRIIHAILCSLVHSDLQTLGPH